MHYAELLPHPRLRPFVRTYWTLSGSGAEIPPQPMLPDGCTELIVHRAHPFWRHHANAPAEQQTPHLFVGQMLAPVVIAPAGDADIVSVRFEPFGAHALLGTPQTETADLIVDAGALQCAWLTRAMARAQSASTPTDALRILERALLARVDGTIRSRTTDRRVLIAANLIAARNGQISIDDAARHARTSARQLERLFQEQIGTSPKRFARVLRFQAAANRVLVGDAASLVDVSAESGYFDQAHMIKDFVTFAGTTPGQFAKRLGALTRAMLS